MREYGYAGIKPYSFSITPPPPPASPITTDERMNSTFPRAEPLSVPMEYANNVSPLPKPPTAPPLTVVRDNTALTCPTEKGATEYPFQFI